MERLYICVCTYMFTRGQNRCIFVKSVIKVTLFVPNPLRQMLKIFFLVGVLKAAQIGKMQGKRHDSTIVTI